MERTVFVHLFEKKWKDTARECEDFLGPKGVQFRGEFWFELKAYISGVGWQGHINQSGTPYSSNNHFATCGKIHIFQRIKDSVAFHNVQ